MPDTYPLTRAAQVRQILETGGKITLTPAPDRGPSRLALIAADGQAINAWHQAMYACMRECIMRLEDNGGETYWLPPAPPKETP